MRPVRPRKFREINRDGLALSPSVPWGLTTRRRGLSELAGEAPVAQLNSYNSEAPIGRNVTHNTNLCIQVVASPTYGAA
jgi:hypothetical protein